MKLTPLIHRLLTIPYIDWSLMPPELQAQRPGLPPSTPRYPRKWTINAPTASCVGG